ncbi:MAG: hypothetical protein H7Y59_19110 [Anaerolineales bacterium]|nr:hypothetical protein [Anaerolineales bacterium]
MSRPKRLILASIFTVIIVITLTGCIFAYQLLSQGCLWWECAPTRSFDVLDLGLPSNLFPSNGSYHFIEVVYGENPSIDKGFQTIQWESSGEAIYAVDKYANNEKSLLGYNGLKNAFSSAGVYNSLWSAPDISKSISSADNFFVMCGTLVTNGENCELVARYQEFVIYFNTTISEKMTTQDFQEVVAFIDNQIASHIYEK